MAGGLTILVVEDQEGTRLRARGHLISEGFEVVEAHDGKDALDLLQSGDKLPDVILLDLKMPRMDGWDLLAHVKSTGDMREIPVIIVTAQDSPEARERAQILGAAGFLVHPIGPISLIQAIRRVADIGS